MLEAEPEESVPMLHAGERDVAIVAEPSGGAGKNGALTVSALPA